MSRSFLELVLGQRDEVAFSVEADPGNPSALTMAIPHFDSPSKVLLEFLVH